MMIQTGAATKVILAGFLAAGIVIPTLHSSAAGSDTLVTTTIADSQNGNPFRVESDLKGSYVNTKLIQSLIQGSPGDWILTTYGPNSAPSNRTVFFDLTEPVSSSNPVPPFETAYVQSHLIAKCHLVNVGFLQIPAGTTVQCPGSFRFQAPNGLWYRLGFQPNNYPGVNPMNVTCNTADAGGCKLWTITPSGTTLTGTDPNPKNINKLLQIDPKTDAAIADLGDYYISFSITVAR
jgi:hypothetical protein